MIVNPRDHRQPEILRLATISGCASPKTSSRPNVVGGSFKCKNEITGKQVVTNRRVGGLIVDEHIREVEWAV